MSKGKEEKLTITALENSLNPKQRIFAQCYVFGFIEKRQAVVHKKKKRNGDDDDVSDDEPEYTPTEFRVRMGNATRSYAKAYFKDVEEELNTCMSEGSRMLRNPKIKAYMRMLIDESGFNDDAMDARLREIVFEGEDKTSVQAIKHYNELKKRVAAQPTANVTVFDMSQRARELLQPFGTEDDTKN